MNASEYLQAYGWKKGEALQQGGLRKPILVKHKKDTRGLGHNSDLHEAWWERMFDGQLKGLDVNAEGTDGVKFCQNEVKPSGISRHLSPLYRMFVWGGVLEGTIDQLKKQQEEEKANKKTKSKKRRKSDSDDETDRSKKKKKEKKKEKKKKSKTSSKNNSGEDWIRQLVQNMDQKVAA